MILRKIAHWLRHSPHVHMRQAGVSSLSDLVGVIDRFLDDNLRYALEWDDFVSWASAAPGIESIRERIAQTEPLFFSSDPTLVAEGIAIVLEERNRAASLVGIAMRPLSSVDAA